MHSSQKTIRYILWVKCHLSRWASQRLPLSSRTLRMLISPGTRVKRIILPQILALRLQKLTVRNAFKIKGKLTGRTYLSCIETNIFNWQFDYHNIEKFSCIKQNSQWTSPTKLLIRYTFQNLMIVAFEMRNSSHHFIFLSCYFASFAEFCFKSCNVLNI